jgi:bacterioferritin (cytochrome b1)
MSDDEVVAKFRRQAADVVSAATADRIVEAVMSLDALPEVTPLVEFETR